MTKRIADMTQGGFDAAAERHWDRIEAEQDENGDGLCDYCGEPCDPELDMCDACWVGGRG